MKKLNLFSYIIIIGFMLSACGSESIPSISDSKETTTLRGIWPGHPVCGATDCVLEAENQGAPEIDLGEAYIVEEEVLQNSEKGLQYQANYYELSNYAVENNYIISEFSLHYSALQAGVQASNIINNGEGNNIVFNESRYNSLINLINFYQEESNPSNIDQILSDLKYDLESNLNKTKSEVIAFVSN